jgi:branched-chain amino acid transport system ATP-binding protein
MMTDLLQVRNLSKQFGGLTAVQDVTFSVREGEIMGLIGPNGAGKTTIFNLITGFYNPTSGEIFFKGRCIARPPMSVRQRLVTIPWWVQWIPVRPAQQAWDGVRTFRPHEITERGIARTFQSVRLFKNLTALENVMAGPHHRTRSGAFAAIVRPPSQVNEEVFIVEEAERLLRFMGLWEYRSELAKNLPYGDQRRLEIARALATGPSLLILDEPAAGLNEQETLELVNLILGIRETGVTVLLIEHDMKMVMGLCERIVVVDHGSLIAEGVPAEIQKNRDVINAYLGEEDD